LQLEKQKKLSSEQRKALVTKAANSDAALLNLFGIAETLGELFLEQALELLKNEDSKGQTD
jgi:hypothetical protein